MAQPTGVKGLHVVQWPGSWLDCFDFATPLWLQKLWLCHAVKISLVQSNYIPSVVLDGKLDRAGIV